MSVLKFGGLALASVLMSLTWATTPTSAALAQQFGSDVDKFLADGEFSLALQQANASNNDGMRKRIADAQAGFGELGSARNTAAMIGDDVLRTSALSSITGASDRWQIDGNGGFPNSAPQGGVTIADFGMLMNLIQETVSTDTWNLSGTGEGSMQPFPSGVYVDAAGVLHRIKSKKMISPLVSRNKFKQGTENSAVRQTAAFRKVSLTRLERAVQLRAAQGKPPTDAMRNLAGITEVRFVMIDEETSEVIIAGPAGDWKQDSIGKRINVENGKPVLQLDDFVVCLRNAYAANADAGKFGCAIVPRKENLADTVAFLETSQLEGKPWQNKLRETLGQQDVDVFGIEPGTHAARVLVDADHHMKLIGMGVEPSIPQVRSYLDRVELDSNGNPPPMDVVRWWFAADYDQLIANEARNIFEFRGPGVKVLSETEFINRDGERLHTGKAVGPTAAFARDFTRHFEMLATHYSIYKELQNVFDLAVVANLIREHDLADKASWSMPFFSADPSGQQQQQEGVVSVFQNRWKCEQQRPVKSVDSVINRRVIQDRRNGETYSHSLVGVSGGVSFDANAFVSADNVETEMDIEFEKIRSDSVADLPPIDRWWWD